MENAIVTRADGNDLLAARQLHLFRLLRKFKLTTDKIRCRICFDKPRSKGHPSCLLRATSAMNHAMLHLNQPIYQCRICSKTMVSGSEVEFHCRTIHKLSSVGIGCQYDDRSDEFQSDILQVFTNCYDWSLSKIDQNQVKDQTKDEALQELDR